MGIGPLNFWFGDQGYEYLDLGRFRNALLLDEAEHHPTESLRQFIQNYDLEASRTKSHS